MKKILTIVPFAMSPENLALRQQQLQGLQFGPDLHFEYRAVKAGPVNYSSHHDFVLGTGQVRVQIGEGHLQLQWHPLPPRVIALLRLQRLAVSFVFEGVEEEARQRFMKHFDLTMQRGGG